MGVLEKETLFSAKKLNCENSTAVKQLNSVTSQEAAPGSEKALGKAPLSLGSLALLRLLLLALLCFSGTSSVGKHLLSSVKGKVHSQGRGELTYVD